MKTADVRLIANPTGDPERPFAAEIEGRIYTIDGKQFSLLGSRCGIWKDITAKVGERIHVGYDEDTGRAWPRERRVELGCAGWRHPGVQGIVFLTQEAVNRRCELGGMNPDEAVYEDTRPTIGEVAEQLRDLENDACGIRGKSNRRWTVGPWDEYFSTVRHDWHRKWPNEYRHLAVFVVTGGSEGLYLHVEAIADQKRELLILGKTCDSSPGKWVECWKSAGRVARYLQA